MAKAARSVRVIVPPLAIVLTLRPGAVDRERKSDGETRQGVATPQRPHDGLHARESLFLPRRPREHWKHLRTSNPVESPFAAVRLRTAAAKRFKKVENATAVIWKTLLVAEKTFRRLDAPELLADVASGVVYVNGVRAVNQRERKAAA